MSIEVSPDGTGAVYHADPWLDVIIVALVLVLLLAPQHLSLWVLIKFSLHQVKREWRKLGKKSTIQIIYSYFS